MKKNRFLYLILPIITLVLEILPYGAVCNFATSPTDTLRETFSYFDLTPFGYANFAPFLTAIVTCIVLILLAIYCFTGKAVIANISKTVLCVGTVLSLCPLIFGINYFSIVGILITLTLISEVVVLFITTNKQKSKN